MELRDEVALIKHDLKTLTLDAFDMDAIGVERAKRFLSSHMSYLQRLETRLDKQIKNEQANDR